MNFLLLEMTFLRYFLPLIIEGNKRGIKSKVFVGKNNKYTNPYRYLGVIKDLTEKYDFEMFYLEELDKYPDLTFFVEGVGADRVNYVGKKVSLVYACDYRHLYDTYISKMDYVIFPNIRYAQEHNKLSSKNLYLGCSKYDVKFSKDEILKKYNLTNSKKCVLISPKNKDLHRINLAPLYETIKSSGYELLVKTRGKDPIQKKYHGDRYFVDDSWFPHTTMELIHISDFVVNFDSTTVEECIMANKPLINFKVKPSGRGAQTATPFLFEYDFSYNLNKNSSKEQVIKALEHMEKGGFSNSFEECKKRYLYTHENSSKKILDSVL
jgi:hypothetical protein